MQRGERRLFARLDAPQNWYASYAEGAGVIHDLCLGGACIRDEDPPYVGDRFEMTLNVDGDRLPVRAVVRHREPGEAMGVQFVGLSDDVKVRLRDYLFKIASKR